MNDAQKFVALILMCSLSMWIAAGVMHLIEKRWKR